jgi:hypothetical protein
VQAEQGDSVSERATNASGVPGLLFILSRGIKLLRERDSSVSNDFRGIVARETEALARHHCEAAGKGVAAPVGSHSEEVFA